MLKMKERLSDLLWMMKMMIKSTTVEAEAGRKQNSNHPLLSKGFQVHNKTMSMKQKLQNKNKRRRQDELITHR